MQKVSTINIKKALGRLTVVGLSGGIGRYGEAMLLPELPTKEFAPCIPDGKDSALFTFRCGFRIWVGYSGSLSGIRLLQTDRRKCIFVTKFLWLYRPSGDILDHAIADSDSICRTYTQKRDIENITIRNSPQSIFICSNSDSLTVSD